MSSESTEHVFTIELFGETFTFRTRTEARKVKRIVALLTQEVSAVERQAETGPSHLSRLAVMIMAGLNVSQKYLELQEAQENQLERMRERAEAIQKRVDDYAAAGNGKPQGQSFPDRAAMNAIKTAKQDRSG